MGTRKQNRSVANGEHPQRKALVRAREMIMDIAQRDVNEAETSHHVKWVFTDVLGYDQFRHITHEHAVRGVAGTDHVDLAITVEEGARARPAMLVELKRVGVPLLPKHIKQASAYAIHTGCNWVLLTNGRGWMLYHIEFLQPPQPVLVAEWNLLEDDFDVLAQKFRLISFHCVRKGILDEYWQKHRVLDSKNLLNAIFSQSTLKILRRELHKATGVRLPVEDIMGGLRRLLNESAISTMEEVSIRFNDRKASKPKTVAPTKRGSTVTLKALLDQGILKAPVPLFRDYKGHRLAAVLRSDGTIEFNGNRYDNPSLAGSAARETIIGRPASTNGWGFWQYKDSKGDVLQLDDARARMSTAS